MFKFHLNPPFAFSTMAKFVLGHRSIYSSSLVLRLYGLNQPGNQREREMWEKRDHCHYHCDVFFSVKMAVPCPEVLLLTSFIALLTSCGAKDAADVLLCCYWRPRCCVNVPCRLLCDDLYASDVPDYWWRPFFSWRPELLLTSKIASPISCLFLRTSKIISDVLYTVKKISDFPVPQPGYH